MNNNNDQVEQKRVAVETAMMVKLGIDLHAEDAVVCRQDGDQLPKPAVRMEVEDLLERVAELIAAGHRVESCYEAGPCGYTLHRGLMKLGANNRVVVPRRWDPEGKRVKTDRRDAQELCDALDRWLRGNKSAFSVVCVPTEQQEEHRAMGRQRAMLVKELHRCVVRGHGLMLTAGVRAPARWWRPLIWIQWSTRLSAELRKRVETWQRQALQLEREIAQWTKQVEAFGEHHLVLKGIGTLTTVLLEMEVLDWNRFTGRRQVGGYTGLCPSEYSTGFTAAPRQHLQARQSPHASFAGGSNLEIVEMATRLSVAIEIACSNRCSRTKACSSRRRPASGNRFMAYPHPPLQTRADRFAAAFERLK
jgi:transposase